MPSYEVKDGVLEMHLGKGDVEDITTKHIKFDDTMFKMSRWLYDTPGVVNDNQVDMTI